ncbi:MAG: TIGR03087 family PEP-CTERM/XrtA system glycosyltransferase [Gammaproteobacteria bacterium]|nr:TIGR03087 family PEP-CTERM/XrtA system glycosyltransferase [Gammaproteobacteria bacterium]
MKPALLFLSHRIPYPPNKGDKIRSFHLLKYLAKRYRIFLAAFIDDPADWQYAEKLSEWCEQTHFIELKSTLGKIRSLKGFLTGEPLTLPYYYSSDMAAWVSEIMAQESVGNILVFSSSMAQYVKCGRFADINRIIDFVDVDSDKWRQYAEKKNWPMSWVYRREARQLLNYEREIAATFSASLLVSKMEAKLFKELAPESASRITYCSNGVDISAFDPAVDFPNPFQDAGPHIVFTGAMDYWPNEDAVVWFVNEVLPAAKKKWPSLKFFIVGSRPSDNVKSLGNISSVVVTGRVPDVKPYLQHATAVIAPMRIARGIQNKVLEAMAMAKPVIVSPMGLEGIDAEHGKEVLIASEADDYIEALDQIISGLNSQLGLYARGRILSDFSWENTLPKIDQWLI